MSIDTLRFTTNLDIIRDLYVEGIRSCRKVGAGTGGKISSKLLPTAARPAFILAACGTITATIANSLTTTGTRGLVKPLTT